MEKNGVVIPKEDEEPDDTDIDYSGSDGTEPSMPEDVVDEPDDPDDWDDDEEVKE